MSRSFAARIASLSAGESPAPLAGGRIGIEKESLRITRDGYIAATPHPAGLGSALTHPFITTDYSEALIELVTPPCDSPWEAIRFMCDVHAWVHEHLGDEMLWALSMPCVIRSEQDIPLARYGTSNVGRMKTVYRRGLGYRYGRYMQAIAGIHFNFSLPDDFWPAYRACEAPEDDPVAFKSAAYFGMVRNVRRFDWLLLYLFGASPAVCKSFMQGRDPNLDELDSATWYGPYATSLRMSDIGYQNTRQSAIEISANSLDDYTAALLGATQSVNPEFLKIGVKVGDEYRQLSPNQLQIENEYYSTVRPKRVARSGERPTSALRRGGVEYVELRALDISPFDPVGISQKHCRFLELFLIYALLEESPPISAAEQGDLHANHGRVARYGREPGLRLRRAGQETTLQDWAHDICQRIECLCPLIDPDGSHGYAEAVREQIAAIDDPDMTPSARFLAELRESGRSLFEFGLAQSENFSDYFRSLAPGMNAHRDALAEASRESIQRQAEIEAADDIDFDDYLRRYFA